MMVAKSFYDYGVWATALRYDVKQIIREIERRRQVVGFLRFISWIFLLEISAFSCR